MFCFFMYYCPPKCVSVSLLVISIFIILLGAATIWLSVRLNNSAVWNAQKEPTEKAL